MKRKIAKVIVAVTGDHVLVGELELRHAQEHFMLPDPIFLELLEMVLKDPTEVLADDVRAPSLYHIFYRLDNRSYLCAVVKIAASGCYFTTMYPTGKSLRNAHRTMKRVKL